MKKNLLNKIFNYFISGIIILMASCTYNPPPEAEEAPSQKEVDMIKVNEYLNIQDRRLIEKYIQRAGWDMKETETGLWYTLHDPGEGEKARKGMVATLAYKSLLLDGTLVYSSENLGEKRFKLGQGGVETGLEEGLLLLNKGDSATFILAPHLAHGLIGDQKKIPPRAALIYHVRLLNLE